MAYSIEQMDRRTEDIRRRRDALRNAGETCSARIAVDTIDDALGIIAELAGRLSGAEGLLTEARRQARVNAGYSKRRIIE